MTAPDTPDALIARAARYYQARAFDAAAGCALDILAQDAVHFDALHLLGVLSLNKGQPADCVSYLIRAARRRPDDPRLNFNLGNALTALKLFAEAVGAFRRALRHSPDDPDTINNLGNALHGMGQQREAVETLQALVTRWPNHAPAHSTLGAALAALGRWDDAVASYRAALAHAPPDTLPARWAAVSGALGGALIELDRVEEAHAQCSEMRARYPDEPALVWNASLAALHLGQYEAGWRDYESRWLVPEHDRPRPDATVPDIGALAGQRILLLGEQGHGDVLQFVRYAPMLAALGATVTLSVTNDLKPLLTGLPGIARVIGEDENEPPYDILTPLMSLPLAFGTTLTTVPATVPYLRAPPNRAEAWRSRLGTTQVPRVGLAWCSTNPGAKRSTRLEDLGPLLDCPGVAFHALQKDMPPHDQEALHRQTIVNCHRGDLTDFAETAALIDSLDLVITIDTAIAHLAGGMAKPVWIMLPFVAEWRWLQARQDSPWYPTARLFRQSTPGDWAGLVSEIAAALRRATASGRFAE